MSLPSKEHNFEKALIDAIDRALAIVGESGKKIILFHLENKYLLKAEDITKKPELFVLAMKTLLGKGGADIETQILKNLCEKLGIDYESLKSTQFDEIIREIRNKST